MTQREKILASTVGVAVGGFLLYQVVNTMVLAPRAELQDDNDEMRTAIAGLQGVQQQVIAYSDEWKQWTAYTLASTVHETQTEFRSRLYDTLQAANFRNPRLDEPKVIRRKVYGDAGFQEVVLGVDVEGTLPQLKDFLLRFYEQPYLATIESLKVSPQTRGRRGTPARGEPQLEIELDCKALVLPSGGDKWVSLDHQGFGTAEEPLGSRLDYEAPGAYELIARANPFKKYAPPPPPPPPGDDEPKEPVVREKPKPPPPPLPNWTLVGTVAVNGHRFAYVRDDDQLAEPPMELTLGDTVHDGELIVIHPRGMVTKMTEDHLGEPVDPPKYFYYPLGKFDSREALDRAKHPEVFQAVQRTDAPEPAAEEEADEVS